jgi:hypothetical protein
MILSATMTFLAKGSRMKNAFLLRTPSRNSAIVLLRDTLAVVHIELHTPLSQEDFVKAQTVHAMAPLPVDVELGQYDMDRTRFTHCTICMDLPTVRHERIDYTRRRR